MNYSTTSKMENCDNYLPLSKPAVIDDYLRYYNYIRDNKCSLHEIPEEFRKSSICLEAVKYRRNALAHMPTELRTMETCLEAVKYNGISLRYVPEKFRTKELCTVAVKR